MSLHPPRLAPLIPLRFAWSLTCRSAPSPPAKPRFFILVNWSSGVDGSGKTAISSISSGRDVKLERHSFVWGVLGFLDTRLRWFAAPGRAEERDAGLDTFDYRRGFFNRAPDGFP